MSHEQDETVVQEIVTDSKPQTPIATTENEIAVYPNPARGLAIVSVTKGKIAKITVTGIDGKPILEQLVGKDVFNLDFSAYQKGLYFIMIETDQGKVHQEKLMKN